MRDAEAVRAAARSARLQWAKAAELPMAEALHCPLDAERLRDVVRAHRLSLIADPRLPDAVLGKYDPARKKIKFHPRLRAPDAAPDLAFVVAHELGHHCLCHDADIALTDGKDTLDQEASAGELGARRTDTVYRVYSERERQELEANLFAAELLAPGEALARAVVEDPAWSVAALASRFGLRPVALEARLAAVLLEGAWDSSSGLPAPIISGTTGAPARVGVEGPVTVVVDRIPDRRQAEAAGPKPALVLAGPGSGKTTVLVDRYLGLIERGEAKASEILALTFTNKAAGEMRERVLARLRRRGLLPGEADEEGKGSGAGGGVAAPSATGAQHGAPSSAADPLRPADVQVTTLHAFALDLITRYAAERDARPPTLLTAGDALLLLGFWRERLPMGAFEDLGDVYGALAGVLDAISLLRDRDCPPSELLRLARKECSPDGRRRDPDSRADRWHADERMRRWRSLAFVYRRYLRFCRQSNHLDFTGVLRTAADLIERDGGEGAPGPLSRRWRHVLVDEYQDMNRPCARLLNALVAGRPEAVWAVGDPRQSIYRFRGATPEQNLVAFRRDHPRALPTALDVNYRSVPDIVTFGRAVGRGIALPEELAGDTALETALAQSGEKAARDTSEAPAPSVVYGVLEDEAEELAFITESVARLCREAHVALDDVAVLCRTKRQATSVALALEARGLPTTWAGALEDEAGFRELICALLFSTGDAVGLEGLAGRYGLGEADLALVRELGAVRTEEDGRPTGPLAALQIALAGGTAGPNGAPLSEEGAAPAAALFRLGDGLSRAAYLSGAEGAASSRGAWRVMAAYLFTHSPAARDLLVRRVRGALAAGGAPQTAPGPSEAGPGEGSTVMSSAEARRVVAWAQTVALARAFPERASAAVLTSHPDGKPRHPVSAFLDYVQVCRRHSRLEVSDEAPTGGPAVHVLTIHRSKGLEWPVVFVPNLTRMRFRVQKAGRVKLPAALEPDEAREEHCIFYVAVTRAQDRLILTRARRYGASPKTHSPAVFLEQAASHLPESIGTAADF